MAMVDEQWEIGFKYELPEFHGGESAQELLDWIFAVEETLDFKDVPSDRRVPMSVTRFRGRAAGWWSQLKASRERLDKPRIESWDKLKKKMRKTFLPLNHDKLVYERFHTLRQGDKESVEEYSKRFFSLMPLVVGLTDSDQQLAARYVCGLREKIRRRLDSFDPLTAAEAQQHALDAEAQIKDSMHRPWQHYVKLSGIAVLPIFVFYGLSRYEHARRG